MEDFSSTKAFGPYQLVEIRDEANQNVLQIAPEKGGTVIKLVLNGVDLLDAYQTPEELTSHDWSKNVILFPFPNRLRDGKYEANGQTYAFPINEANTQTALHGFGLNLPFQQVASPSKTTLQFQYTDSGKNPAYPFPYQLTLKYALKEDTFTMQMIVKNTGSANMPVGMGWHPYFQTDPMAEAQLRTPPLQKVKVDDRLLPTGQTENYNDFQALRPIGDTLLDNAFEAAADAPPLELKTKDYHIQIGQKVEGAQRNYFQLFMPPYGNAIAIEPVTCNINAFQNGDGLVWLPPGEETTFHCWVRKLT